MFFLTPVRGLMEILALIWGTVLLRPYVFVFLVIFLVIASINLGLIRTLIFTTIAFTIAFLSEYSSTRNGFPYGLYSYIDTTQNQEFWIAGIPFFDPLSFSFLAYISYSMSLLLWSRLDKRGWDIRLVEEKSLWRSWKVILSGAILFMFMDVIIDPVAYLGDRWFLGKIYTYAEKGEYFNIPLSNFGGWFLVGLVILFLYTRFELLFESFPGPGPYSMAGKALLGPALYFSILTFNLVVTFFIGEIILGLCGLVLFSMLLVTSVLRVMRTKTVSDP